MKYDTEHIDKYLNGELLETEVKAFEEQMKNDKDLAYEVKLQEVAVETVQYANFMDKIGDIRAEIVREEVSVVAESSIQEPLTVLEKSERSGVIRRLPLIIGLAAAALIALLIWQPWQNSLYKPYVFNTTQMSRGDQTLQKAQEAYNSGKYAVALPLLENFPDKPAAQIAKGNAEYNLKKWDAAAKTFKGVVDKNNPYFTSTANWYLALTYIQQDEGEKAKAALQKIPDSSSYHDQAETLLKKIK